MINNTKLREIVIDRYLFKIAPKKERGEVLSKLDQTIYDALQAKFSGNEATYERCVEAIGRVLVRQGY